MAALPQIQSAIPRKGETREPSGFAQCFFRPTLVAPTATVEERLFRAASRNSIDSALKASALKGDILLHCRNAAMNGRSSTDLIRYSAKHLQGCRRKRIREPRFKGWLP